MADRFLDKLIRSHYDEMAARGEDFRLEDVIAAVLDDPALDSATDEIVEAAVSGVVERIDKRRTQRDEDQPSLFGDNEQVVALGDGRRKRKGSMDLDDTQAHLMLVAENRARVNAAADREIREAEMLAPYQRRGMTWEQAAQAWADDNPGQVA